MTQFNIQRMKQYAQWQIACHRSNLLKIAGMMVSVLILFFFFRNYVTAVDPSDHSILFFLMWISCLLFCGAFTFPGLSAKQNRTTLLMLPASKAEKFVTSYTGVLLTALILPPIAFVVADLVQYLVQLLVNYDKASLTFPSTFSSIFKDLATSFDARSWETWFFVLSLLWLHSFYVLCGVFFKKLRLLWGTITLGVLTTTISTIIALSGYFFMKWLQSGDFYSIELMPWAEDCFKWGFIALLLLLNALNYGLSYRIFSRLQVINNRFYNW